MTTRSRNDEELQVAACKIYNLPGTHRYLAALSDGSLFGLDPKNVMINMATPGETWLVQFHPKKHIAKLLARA
jgi:hypothetical protein